MKGVLYNSQYSVLLELTRNWLNSKSRGTMLPARRTRFCLVTFRNVSRPFTSPTFLYPKQTYPLRSIVNAGMLRINATYRPKTGKNIY